MIVGPDIAPSVTNCPVGPGSIQSSCLDAGRPGGLHRGYPRRGCYVPGGTKIGSVLRMSRGSDFFR